MKCERSRGLLSAYIDGALSDLERRVLENHLAECAACREELHLMQEADQMLHSVLYADAVPCKPMEEFLAACTAEDPKWQGGMASFVEWLAAPKRVVASTVAGSFIVTAVLTLLAWLGTPDATWMPIGQPQMLASNRQYVLLLTDSDSLGEREWEHGL